MPGNPYVFADAEETRDKILRTQKREIEDLYLNCAAEIDKMARYYANKQNASAALQAQYYNELKMQILAQAAEVSKSTEQTITRSAHVVSDSVAKCNSDWLKSYGIEGAPISAAFSAISDYSVRSVLSGAIYKDGQGLSSRIWRDLQQTQHDINTILAQAQVEQKSVYETAKELEEYVNPKKQKNWNLKMADGRYVYKSKVDYNAQRLARTIAQHTYQKTLVNSTAKNPFVGGFIWLANGSRACQVCLDRDGIRYDKLSLPLDHPQGMCTFEPVIPSDDEITSRLADWVAGGKGDDPGLDEFAESLGFEYE